MLIYDRVSERLNTFSVIPTLHYSWFRFQLSLFVISRLNFVVECYRISGEKVLINCGLISIFPSVWQLLLSPGLSVHLCRSCFTALIKYIMTASKLFWSFYLFSTRKLLLSSERIFLVKKLFYSERELYKRRRRHYKVNSCYRMCLLFLLFLLFRVFFLLLRVLHRLPWLLLQGGKSSASSVLGSASEEKVVENIIKRTIVYH